MRKICLALAACLILFTLCSCTAVDNGDSITPPAITSTDNADNSQSSDSTMSQDETTSSSDDETTTEPSEADDQDDITAGSDGMLAVEITVDAAVFDAKLYDNESARAIIGQMPFSLDMDDYARQEKVTDLSFDLPSAVTETPSNINIGDIYLWSGNSLVLFYTSFSNSYSYVPVGYIENPTGLVAALGSGSVTVAFDRP